MITILDNRKGQEGLEILECGSGKWYAVNTDNGKCIALRFRYQAEDAVKNPEYYELVY